LPRPGDSKAELFGL